MQNLSDAELVALYKQSKDKQYLTTLFTRHSDVVYRSALRIMKNSSDAEDIMQTGYCKMIRDLHLYNGSGSVLGWMIQVIIHTCYQQKNSEKSRLNREKIIMSERATSTEPKNNEMSEIVENHLNKLPDIYKVPITLQIMEGLSIREVSQALEIPEKTIRSQIARGLEKLKVSLLNVGFTASVVSIGDLLKEVQLPMAPATLKTSGYYNSIFQNTSSSSAKIAMKMECTKFLTNKFLGMMLLSAISVVGILLWQKNNTVTNATVKNIEKNQKWNFENTNNLVEYQNIGLVKGGLTIAKSLGENNSNGLVVDVESVVEFDISKYQLPIRISFKIDPLMASAGEGQMILKCNYIPNNSIYYLSGMREKIPTQEPKDNLNASIGFMGQWYTMVSYVSEDFVDLWTNDKLTHILKGSSADNKKLFLYLKGQAIIDNLSIESIDKKELPDHSIYEKIISDFKLKKEVDTYQIDKEKWGLDKNIEINPKIVAVDPVLFEKRLRTKQPTIYPRIGETNQVEWTNLRQEKSIKWNFDSNTLDGIEIVFGRAIVSSTKGINNSSCLIVDAGTLLEFDISMFQLPLKFEHTFDCNIPVGKVGDGILVLKGNYEVQKNIFSFCKLSGAHMIDISEVAKKNKNENVKDGYFGEWNTRTVFISDDCIDLWMNGKRNGVVFASSINNQKLYFLVKDKTIFTDFEVKSVAVAEIPDHSAFNKIVAKFPFKKTFFNFNLESEIANLGIDASTSPKLEIYDKFTLENSLGLRKNFVQNSSESNTPK